jgi:hypothetical protein
MRRADYGRKRREKEHLREDGGRGMKRFAAVLIIAAVISAAALAGFHLKRAFRDAGEAEAGSLRRRVYALEAENDALARDLARKDARAEAAIGMAEELLYYTRLVYPMKKTDIIEELASYQRDLLALLDKLREIK